MVAFSLNCIFHSRGKALAYTAPNGCLFYSFTGLIEISVKTPEWETEEFLGVVLCQYRCQAQLDAQHNN
jgi:hypothetical protein